MLHMKFTMQNLQQFFAMSIFQLLALQAQKFPLDHGLAKLHMKESTKISIWSQLTTNGSTNEHPIIAKMEI